MLEQLKEMLKEVVEDEELIPTMAKGLKKMYDSLIAAGFTADQAIQIVSSQGMGVKTN